MYLQFLILICCATAGNVVTGTWSRNIRLVEGETPNAGRLEVLHNNVWGSVCDDYFDDTAASVACADLGFGFGGRLAEISFSQGTGQIWLDDVQCIGTESSLAECRHRDWGVHNCGHGEDVSIVCANAAAVEFRLVGGPVASEGRLEVKYNETWGTICDDTFDDVEASVACASLGFQYGGRFARNAYGTGTGKIWMDNVRCGGSESTLAQCRHNGWGEHDCVHKEDVSIVCLSHTTTTTSLSTSQTVWPTTTHPTCSRSSTNPSLIHTETGWFTSENYPLSYSNSMDCYWLIESSYSNGVVSLNFTDFDLESVSDYVTLYDGATPLASRIATLDDVLVTSLSYRTTQKYMLVHFHSDYSVTYRGFNATHSSTGVLSTPTASTTTTATTVSQLNTENDHKVIWDNNGTITSPNYPLEYNSNSNRSWLIRSADPNKIISLIVVDFDTESDYDVLNVYDGTHRFATKLASLSGHHTYMYPSTYTTTQNSMYVTFTSDSSIQYRGFSATIQIKPSTVTRTVTSTSHSADIYDYESADSSAEISISTDPFVLTAPSGVITSPRYPNNYPNDVVVSWLIVAPPNGIVVLTVDVVDVETCCDHLNIHDGDNRLAPKINYTATMEEYRTTQRHMFISFTSDSSISGRGFQTEYTTISGRGFHTEYTTISTKGSNKWVFGAIIASSVTAFLIVAIFTICKLRKRRQITLNLRRRYTMVRSESDDNSELVKEQQHQSFCESKEDESKHEGNNQQLVFILGDDSDWKITGQNATDNFELNNGSAESTASPTKPAEIDCVLLPAVHISRGYKTAYDNY